MNAGIAGLALVTAVLVGAALSSDAETAPSTLQSTYTPVPARTSATVAPVSLSAARSVLARKGDVTISVLGDSTGNDSDEWVRIVAQKLGESRRVTVRTWDGASTRYGDPRTYGESGARVTIWNFSVPGQSAAQPVDQLGQAQPEKPDLVVLNFGHNNRSSNITRELTQLQEAVQARWGKQLPMVAMVQNPETGAKAADQASVRDFVARWSGEHQVAYIDIAAAFKAQGDFKSLMRDDIHPNSEGSKLWAATVVKALRV